MILEEIKNIKATTTEVRKFAVTMGIVLLIIAGFLWWKDQPAFQYFVIAAVSFAGIGLLLPVVMKPIYRAWMTFAVVMGFVMTRVILSIMFFLVFTPIGLIARLLGKDLLDQRIDKNASSYWIERSPSQYDPKTSEQMF